MPASEIKQRKRGANETKQGKQLEEEREPPPGPSGDTSGGRKAAEMDGAASSQWSSAGRAGPRVSAALWVAVCLGLAWFALHQNGRLAELEQKCGRAAELLELRERVTHLSDKFDGVQALLVQLQEQAVLSQWEQLQGDIADLKGWAAGATEKRERLQATMADLSQAVGHIEERTAAVAKDAGAQVSAARTDVRRMSGLASDVEMLLERVGALEENLARAELSMAKRIGDLLAGSIDRVAALRASSEKNSQAVERLQRGAAQLAGADSELAGRILALETGRARLVKTVTIASDLKPKVSTVKRDLAMLEPLLSDLTSRIGQLAQDVGHREQDVGELRDTIAKLSSLRKEL